MKSVLGWWGLTAAVLLALSGCHPFRSKSNSCHKPQPYAAAKSSPPLRIPAGLDVPDTTNALHIPDLKEPAPPARKGKDPCLDEPPSYKVVKPAAPQA
ncbi:MAG: hypothetical protein JWN85_993 [Gammaproteobacteria bacterium]|nr:hypothetical protein [Gammaproteobacteria bacterium]